MLTHRNIDKICILITVLAVLVTALFMNGEKIGIAADDSVTMSYEDKLFDDSYVHTIDIEMSDWDSLIENATAEEYSTANVTIDGETVKNVGIRAKGNTSLSTVSQLGSERYSFKIEFDAYQKNNTYYGLDKLCLNNLIQDYTMMKDYLAYKLMYEFGANSPLVSFCFITVNGEDWGLYLAVEAVEDSFLERNYGSNFGDLYKPDSMSMGGGRGNGGGFDMKDMDFDQMGMKNPFERDDSSAEDSEESEKSEDAKNSEDTKDSKGSGKDRSKHSDRSNAPDFSGEGAPDFSAEGGSDSSDGDGSGFPGGGPDFSGGGPDFSGGGPGDGPGGGFPGGFGGFGMGSSDAKLQYSDDNEDSYSTIFGSAKTPVTTADKNRLIKALKSLSEGLEAGDADTIAEGVNIEEVMRYMVVHNFLVNGDSYTGNMIHNYYLYEENGKLSMIPWDYNLAYGTFQADDSTSAVNDPIDTPLSITEGSTDRPMFSWITSCEEYTQMYHEYYQEFLDQFYTNGYLSDLVTDTYEMIKDYVDRDPTKFCTYEEFEKAVSTMSTFVELRCQSISGQLDGTIGSTDSEQNSNAAALIDASSIKLSDLGSMGGGGGDRNDKKGPDSSNQDNNGPDSSKQDSSDQDSNESDTRLGGGFPGGGDFPGGGFPGGGDFPGSDSSTDGDSSSGGDNFPRGGDFPGSSGFPGGGDFPGDFSGMNSGNTTNYIYLGVSAAALLLAMMLALLYRGRR